MQPNQYDIDPLDLMYSIDQWSTGENDTFIVTSNTSGGMFDSVVPYASVAELHQDLPEVIDILLRQSSHIAERNYVRGSLVAKNLRYLDGSLICVNNTAGETLYLDNIRAITNSVASRNVHVFNSTKCYLKEHKTAGETRLYVALTSQGDVAVLDSELEQRYPGWKTRWDVGTQLGVDMDELIPYAFSKPAEAMVVMPDVDFD